VRLRRELQRLLAPPAAPAASHPLPSPAPVLAHKLMPPAVDHMPHPAQTSWRRRCPRVYMYMHTCVSVPSFPPPPILCLPSTRFSCWHVRRGVSFLFLCLAACIILLAALPPTPCPCPTLHVCAQQSRERLPPGALCHASLSRPARWCLACTNGGLGPVLFGARSTAPPQPQHSCSPPIPELVSPPQPLSQTLRFVSSFFCWTISLSAQKLHNSELRGCVPNRSYFLLAHLDQAR